ncbi:hypothetical protein [Caulobacter sp. NIBR2454]|uniref:hypothetical protein n=1 Tax=Caulobacter sp. NIBR2454 TaxID=3015996 RepID=UPI0022B6F909|nr:hypothetical protein [Caulobacter sp. NIBR2454]
MIATLASQIATFLSLAIFAYALLRGERTERIAAAAMLVAIFASGLILTSRTLFAALWIVFFIDLGLLALLAALAAKGRRIWPAVAAAFQLIGAATHAATALDLRIGGWAYATATWICSAGVVLALLSGMVSLELRRLRVRRGRSRA